ncbi:MAG TPA: molybdopterin biosynthesis protein [Firmicutes bacterium]|nr:molybdopterin biosynthesis protein [Bacillota bacterium]
MKEKRKRYLHNTTIQEAKERFLRRPWPPAAAETVAVPQAVGRITAEAVFARLSSPHYHAAAMDGVAVKAEDTTGAGETTPKRLRLHEKAFPIDTGNALPPGCNAVIMAEDITESGDEVEIIAPAAPWQHVRPIGEDIVATEMLLPAGHRIRPVDAGALLAGGINEVKVYRKPAVAVIPTGNELVPPGSEPQEGQIIEYNSTVFATQIREWGGEAKVHPIVPDDFAALKAAVRQAVAESDLVLINAGSSAGRRDYTADVVEALGEVLVHGVAVKPGKPVVLGAVSGKPVIGVPGYPVSAMVALELFVKPFLYMMQGLREPDVPQLAATFSRQLTSALSAEEWVRVKVGRVGESYIATPLSRGAGVITSLVRADGIVRIPQHAEGLAAGEKVAVNLLRPLEDIDRTIVCIGSHDLTLDILGDLLAQHYPGYSLSSAHVGSTGGIMALKRGEAHLAGTHLLDEETGEYNIPFLKKFLPDVPVLLLTLIERDQGLIVAPGNPKKIYDIEDLVRPDVTFVNRQRGAGTRLLLDARLRAKGLAAEQINGYRREEYTHLAVAAAVKAGSADAGLGVMAAAVSLGLDFVPLALERYDLAIPVIFEHDDKIEKLLTVINSREYKDAVGKMGGYHTKNTGKIVWRGEAK